MYILLIIKSTRPKFDVWPNRLWFIKVHPEKSSMFGLGLRALSKSLNWLARPVAENEILAFSQHFH